MNVGKMMVAGLIALVIGFTPLGIAILAVAGAFAVVRALGTALENPTGEISVFGYAVFAAVILFAIAAISSGTYFSVRDTQTEDLFPALDFFQEATQTVGPISEQVAPAIQIAVPQPTPVQMVQPVQPLPTAVRQMQPSASPQDGNHLRGKFYIQVERRK